MQAHRPLTRVRAVQGTMTVYNNPRVLLSVLVGFGQVADQPRALFSIKGNTHQIPPQYSELGNIILHTQ